MFWLWAAVLLPMTNVLFNLIAVELASTKIGFDIVFDLMPVIDTNRAVYIPKAFLRSVMRMMNIPWHIFMLYLLECTVNSPGRDQGLKGDH